MTTITNDDDDNNNNNNQTSCKNKINGSINSNSITNTHHNDEHDRNFSNN